MLLRNRFGRGQIRGTASTSQISAILGPARLRKNRHVIRPDLYPGPRSGRVTATDLPSLGWRLGNGAHPRCGALWVPWDRTAGVVGPQGSGKTLDVLIPALLAAPGAAEQARVERLKQITPGDFAAVLRHGRLMPLTSATALVAGLETECALKHGGARHTMGFV